MLSAGSRALLASYENLLSLRTVTLDDALRGHANDVAVVILAVGTGTVDDTPRLPQLLQPPPCPPVLVFSDVDDLNMAIATLRKGAAGYILSYATSEELFAAVQRAAAGQVIMDPHIGGRIAGHLAGGTWWPGTRLDAWDLEPRERQVLELLSGGRNNREIASALNLGEATIKTYLRSLYRKLGVRDRSQAIALVLQDDSSTGLGSARNAETEGLSRLGSPAVP